MHACAERCKPQCVKTCKTSQTLYKLCHCPLGHVCHTDQTDKGEMFGPVSNVGVKVVQQRTLYQQSILASQQCRSEGGMMMVSFIIAVLRHREKA